MVFATLHLDRYRIPAGGKQVGGFASTDFGTRTFCRQCGSPLSIHVRHQPDEIDIPVGTLDDPEEVAPTFHLYAAEAPSWMPMTAFLPRYQALRPKTRGLPEGQTEANS
ncbi:MAG: GFA family protein [Sphingopyxis sp.]|nr:GFA family protein [Sphingopyxis sp.]